MKLFTWIKGRQESGYRKMCLFQFNKSDCYLIHYPVGSSIPTHTDPVPTHKHYRFNLRLLGEDAYVGDYIFKIGRLIFFRPDIMPHSVKQVSSERYILSFGFVK